MSDTDDTDDLLLIPPDFFIINSDNEDNSKPYRPYYEVVDSLITQVNRLENRINSIESTSDSSLVNHSLDYCVNSRKIRSNLMSSFRKFNSWEDIPPPYNEYIGSTQSTPQKPKSKIKVNSLPSTPSSDRYGPVRPRFDIGARMQQEKLYIPQSLDSTKCSSPNSSSTASMKQNSQGPVQKAQNEMLSEIDNFIENVKIIQNHNVSRDLNREFELPRSDNEDKVSTLNRVEHPYPFNKSRLNLNDVDHMLHVMESQQREIESKLKEKEHEFGVKKNTVETDHQYRKEIWQPGENKGSVPDRGMGLRDLLYQNQYQNVNNKIPLKENVINCLTVTALNAQEVSTSDLSAKNSDSILADTSSSFSSSDSTQMTAYQNKPPRKIVASSNSNKIDYGAMQALSRHKDLLSRTSTESASNASGRQTNGMDAHKGGKKTTHSFQNDLFEGKSNHELPTRNSLALLSLADLWSQNSTANDQSKFVNKLQEEKLRRQHCEQLIQQLQTRTLELQERLAVAVQVDQAKDEAIMRVHKSWEEAVAKIDGLSQEKAMLERQISELKTKVSFELSEAAKKMNHYENESSKALNLAHNNQEKLVVLEKQNTFLTAEVHAYQDKLKSIQDRLTAEQESNQQLSKILSQKEIELNEVELVTSKLQQNHNKNILSDARKEIAQSKRAVELCQAELVAIKRSQNQLEQQLTEELQRGKALEVEKSRLLNEIESSKRTEKSLQDELNKQKDLIEQNKIELRNFYQDQVEIVVREKLKEFQAQLEKAENSLHDEIRNRELAVAKAAALHIQQVTEKHALEIHLIEEKHKEEVKLYKLQLSQTQQQIENLHAKIQQHQERRSNIAQQLHRVMEAQWLEAIRIINNSKSPVLSQDKSTNTLDQLNSLKSKSYNNVEEILLNEDPIVLASNKAGGDFKVSRPYVPVFQPPESMLSFNDHEQYDKDVNQIPLETPLTSRPQKSRQQTENELQKYIQMLLNKSPGNPVEDQNSKYHEKLKHPTSEQTVPPEKLNPDGTKSNKLSNRDKAKRPWK